VEAAQWTSITILAAGLFGAIFHLGSKIDRLGSGLRARIDALGGELGQRIDALSARADATNARIDSHLERHTG